MITQTKERIMIKRAQKFLEDLDVAYERRRIDSDRDYCLRCCVPGSDARPFRRNHEWIPYAEFHPTKKISELLERHGINLVDFLTAWVEITGLSISGQGNDPMVYWRNGHMPSGCPSRSTIIRVLEHLDDASNRSA